MKNNFLTHLTIVTALLFPNINFAQAPNLGVSSSFALFTAGGAFNGDPGTSVVGDIGTNSGPLSPPGLLVGQIHISDPVTVQAAMDVSNAYMYLAGLTCGSGFNTPFGNGQILTPDTYCIGSAAELNGNLILDALGDPGAIFIFKIGGALSTNSFSSITLANGANLCNVYWRVDGALNLGGSSTFLGTALVEGAINLAFGAFLNGRGLSTAGAINTSANMVTVDPCDCSLTVTCPPASGGAFQCISDIPVGVAADVTINTSCGVATVAITETSSGTGCTASPFILVRTYTATDTRGNTTACVVTYTAADNMAPVITCPTVVSPILCPAVRNFGLATAIDACDATVSITFTDSPTPGGSCILGVGVTRIWMATDDCGNTAPCSRTISVVDNNLPVITCPTVVSPIQCPATPNFGLATATDGCDANPAITFTDVTTPGPNPQEFSVTRTWIATDDCGNTAICNSTIIVAGYTLPTIICPPNIIKNTDLNLCGAVVTYPTPMFSTGCGGSATLERISGLPSGSVFPKGTTTVNWKVTDALGNMAICGFTVTINDNQPPAITCPTNIDKWTAANQCNAVVFYAVKGLSDNCPGVTSSVMSGLPSGSAFPKGITTIVLKATDGAGLMKNCSFTIKVSDGQPPAILCPPNQATSTDPILCTAIVTYPSPTATDNCTPPPVVTIQSGLPSGSSFPKGITTVVWRATDGAGLTKTCSFRVTVNDTQAPAIICPAPISKNTDADQCSAVTTYPTPAFTDNCPGGSLIRLSGLASGSAFPKGVNVVVWKATDAAGNFRTCSFTVTVSDLQLPAITCPANIALANDPMLCGATVLYPNPPGLDNCPNVIVGLQSGLASNSVFPVGVSVIVLKATDSSGNTQTCSFFVTITDTQPPMIMCPGNRTVNGIGVPCSYPSANLLAANVMMENCPDFTVTSNAPTLLLPGVTLITWTAVDASNNESTCSYAVTVICPTSPVIGGTNGGNAAATVALMAHRSLGLTIAPNPATSQVMLLLEGVGEQGGELTLFDPLGRMVWQQFLTGEQAQVSLDVSHSNFASGIYQVRVRTEDGIITKGLVVNKL